MRKTLSILFVLLTLAFPVSVKAQYYSINVDYGTMEAMSEAFTTEAAFIMRTFRRSMTATKLPKLPVPVSFLQNTLTGKHSLISIYGMTVRKTTTTTVSIRLSHGVLYQR